MHPALDRRSFLGGTGLATAGFATGLVSACAAPAVGAPAARGGDESGARAGLTPAADWLLAPGLAYLQTGSLGPSPRPVIERTLAAWEELEQNPTAYAYRIHIEAMEAVRARAAAFLGCAVGELALTRCTTEGMNAVALALELGAGDRVLMTDKEHPGGRRGWEFLAKRRGVVLDEVPIPPGESDAGAIVARFRERLRPATRVLSFSHVLSGSGLRMPVAELSALAREHGCLAVVDGAQAAGAFPVDVAALGCHVYATSGHKWMLGPKGTGLLCIREEARERVDVMALQSGPAVYTDAVGMTNVPGVLGLGAAIEYLEALGLPAIEAHGLALRAELARRLADVPRTRIVSPPDGPLATSLLSIQLDDDVPSRALQQALLERHAVMVKVVPEEWFNGLRFSTHLFNSERDVERAADALRAELA